MTVIQLNLQCTHLVIAFLDLLCVIIVVRILVFDYGGLRFVSNPVMNVICAKTALAYFIDPFFISFKNRPDRGQKICSKIEF